MSEDRWKELGRASARYYAGRLAEHGASARGVDWNSEESQRLRFDQLLRLLPAAPSEATVNDFGCGYGALLEHLRERGHRGRYTGFDLASEMVERARELHRGAPDCRFTSDPDELGKADFTVASGVFNVKLEADDEDWWAYVRATIRELARRSGKGFAFNVLTLDSDPERRRPDLFYADPAEVLEHCRRRYSPRVALLQDYGLYEMTMVVRKRLEEPWRGW